MDETEVTEAPPEAAESEAAETDATSGDATEAAGEEAAEPVVEKVRRGKGNLEADVKGICDAYAKGDITLADGEYLTPHRIGKLIHERLAEPTPSTGAVAACLKRWVDYGYIVVNEKTPFAFIDFTDAARTEGLAALKTKFKEAAKAAKAAAASASAEGASGASAGSPESDASGEAPEASTSPEGE